MKKFSLYVMAGLYVAAGVIHFINPAFYRPIMPPWIPWHDFLIALSGVIEICLGLLLLVPRYRRFAACSIIAMLIVFLSVHFYMWGARDTEFKALSPVLIFLRIPLQFALMAWAYVYARSLKVERKLIHADRLALKRAKVRALKGL